MKDLLLKHINRHYYYLNGYLFRVSDGAYLDNYYFLIKLNQIFAIKNEELIIILNDWFFDRFRVDSRNFWSPIKYIDSPHIISFSADVGEFTPNITMLARYGSKTINEDYFEVIRITE